MMLAIRFSHDYPKLWGQKTAELLGLKIIDREGIHDDLIKYDTRFTDKEGNVQHYVLPPGKLIQLFFVGDKGIPFCTIRRHTPEKLRYYHDLLLTEFIIEVEN